MLNHRWTVVCVRMHGTRAFARGLTALGGIKQQQRLRASCLPAIPVMRSDPFASCGGRTCLYSSCSQAATTEELITEELWSNVNTMPHKQQCSAHQMAQQECEQTASAQRISWKQTNLWVYKQGNFLSADPCSAPAEDLVFLLCSALN